MREFLPSSKKENTIKSRHLSAKRKRRLLENATPALTVVSKEQKESKVLLTQIQNDLKVAMKAKDNFLVGALRFLLSDVKNFEINNCPPGSKKTLTDEDVLGVLSKQVKTHKESVEMFKKGEREDLVVDEKKQIAILQKYLPAELSEDEVRKMVVEVLQGIFDKSNFGLVMKEVMGKMRGRVEGGVVSRVVKEEITKSI